VLRFVKSVSEFEGSYSESWVVVDDAEELAPWAADQRFDVLGKPATRQDGDVRATGRARFTVDVVLPGMLHAAVVRSPVAHARVTGVDVEAALRVPGVRAAIGPDDASVAGGALERVIAAEPEYAGCPIAVVAADTPEAAAAGAAALAPRLEALPHIVTFEDALRREALSGEPVSRTRGDAEAQLAAADVTVELTGETPGHLQSALEPHAAVVRWDGDDAIEAWISTQGIFSAREELAEAYAIPLDRVRVHAEYIGGGFGAKQGAGKEGLMAAELARRTGRPVRLANDRHGEQLDGGIRVPSRQTYRLGGTRDGIITAVDTEAMVGRGSMFFQMVNTPALTLYQVEHVQAIAGSLALHSRPGNAFRAPGITEGVTVYEQAVDELAIALEIDPLELRRRNHAEVDQNSGEPYSSKALLACYDRAAELAGWADRDALTSGPGEDGLLRGMGCATQIWFGGGGPPANATVRIGGDGVATVTTGVQDIGTGTLTAMQIVVAEQLGLPLDRVVVTGGDTLPNVYGPVSGGSQTVPSVSPAVRGAAAVVQRRLLELAGSMYELSPDDLELRDGRIRSADRTLDRPYTEVTDRLGDATIDGSGSRGPNPDGMRTNTFGCQIATVAVDPGTGEVRVERIVAVHDVGRIINPLGASSQMEGGILQGMAFALMEERVLDPTLGAPTNASLDDYKLPTIADTPEIVVDFVDAPDLRLSNVGAKGLGEPPIVPTAAAIANAFRHATGRRVRTLPMTRSRVLEALA
jgi:xanthine dehydrogenase YagR molybdenum-binding subunit